VGKLPFSSNSQTVIPSKPGKLSSKPGSKILTLAYNRQDIDTTGLIIHFIKNVLSE